MDTDKKMNFYQNNFKKLKKNDIAIHGDFIILFYIFYIYIIFIVIFI
jgi:hypothetical protein